MANENELTLADAIVGEATAKPTSGRVRQRTKGMMAKEQQIISSRPLDPVDSLPSFVREHLDAIRETRPNASERLKSVSDGSDMFDAQLSRNEMGQLGGTETDYSALAGEVKSNSLYDVSNKLTKDLMRDFDLTKEQAAAFVGNLAVESMDFKQLQEIKPLVKGSKGGFGFAQWTGDRRVAFEDWAKKNKLDPRSYEANYGYLKKELSTKDPVIGTIGINTINKLKETNSIEEATNLVSEYYLRPGIPHIDKRQAKSKVVYSMIME